MDLFVVSGSNQAFNIPLVEDPILIDAVKVIVKAEDSFSAVLAAKENLNTEFYNVRQPTPKELEELKILE